MDQIERKLVSVMAVTGVALAAALWWIIIKL